MLSIGRRLSAIGPLVAALALGSQPGLSYAHEGPPFPLFMDSPLGEVKVSLWADPDIGEARFFIVVETAAGAEPKEEYRASLWTEPINGRLPRQQYSAQREPLRNRMQFHAEPHFDIQDHWKIGVTLTGADGQPRELITEVESTPPGFGPWDLAIYLFPFVLLGSMWGVAMLRRHRNARGRPVSEMPTKRSNDAVLNSATPSDETLGQDNQAATGGAR